MAQWIPERAAWWTPEAIRAASRGFLAIPVGYGCAVSLLDELETRGLFADCTNRDELGKLLGSQMVPVYAGFDPTQSSLHVGNLVPVIMLKRFQLAGHRPVIVVGGATGMVGDPSGKSAERNLLDDATLATNVAGVHAQLARLLDFEDPKIGAVMTNNADWTRGISYLEFLRDIGKHLTINYMMAKDSVRSRLEGDAGISYTEFSYMLLQAFDFVHLSKSHGCRVQLGGSDQYGNITAGCELSRKMGGVQLFGLTAPLLLDSSGNKMGKTATGETVWLDADRMRPYDYYQYWLNRTDEEAPRLLRMFSLRPLVEIEAVLAEHEQDRAKRTAQRELARGMTTWVHGDSAVVGIEAATRVMFSGTKLTELSKPELDALASTLPTIDIARSELEGGLSFVDLIARATADSKGAARRLIAQGGAYINDAQTKDVDRKVTLSDLATENMLVLRSGKKSYHLVRVV
jgi:tyrosyl-tRNA synthetase